MKNGALGTLQRFNSAVDQFFPRLAEQLQSHSFRHPVLVNDLAQKIKIRLRRRWKTDFNFNKPDFDKQLKKLWTCSDSQIRIMILICSRLQCLTALKSVAHPCATREALLFRASLVVLLVDALERLCQRNTAGRNRQEQEKLCIEVVKLGSHGRCLGKLGKKAHYEGSDHCKSSASQI